MTRLGPRQAPSEVMNECESALKVFKSLQKSLIQKSSLEVFQIGSGEMARVEV